MRALKIMTLVALGSVSAHAGEKPIALKPAPGVELVEANCNACHSLDYIHMNSRFLAPAQWEGEVAKMIKLGAPLDEREAKAIAEYLKNNY